MITLSLIKSKIYPFYRKVSWKSTLFLCVVPSCLFSEPWGKDADLVHRTSASCCVPKGPLAKLGAVLVRFHQNVISPVDGPRSHYTPSSSQYTYEAMCRYGFFKGVMMGCDRLLRENNEPGYYPIVEVDGRPLKYDPVK